MTNSNNVEVLFAKTKEDAIIPSKREEDAGMDIYANFEERELIILSGETVMIETGIASVIPIDYYMQLQERGSTGTKGMKYGAGVIDSGYRGEWMVPISNVSNKTLIISKDTGTTMERLSLATLGKAKLGISASELYTIYPYDKAIAQAVLLPVPKTTIKEVSLEELQSYTSERGEGRLGESGK